MVALTFNQAIHRTASTWPSEAESTRAGKIDAPAALSVSAQLSKACRFIMRAIVMSLSTMFFFENKRRGTLEVTWLICLWNVSTSSFLLHKYLDHPVSIPPCVTSVHVPPPPPHVSRHFFRMTPTCCCFLGQAVVTALLSGVGREEVRSTLW